MPLKIWQSLTPKEAQVIEHHGTEPPYSGDYHDTAENGLYVCRRCQAPLYRSLDKFQSHCGWPSFEDEIHNAVKHLPDPDGHRTEILCAHCEGHLGHVFQGEGFTLKNTRHCVNSVSMRFLDINTLLAATQKNETPWEAIIVAGGCFWGIEYFFEKEHGVLATSPGYIGGQLNNPSYEEVCTDRTGHAEAVAVIFDPRLTSVTHLYSLFFKIHDPRQLNQQGPDKGSQYRSGIFYLKDAQKKTAETLIEQLKKKGISVVTTLEPAPHFWPAEKHHQHYFSLRDIQPTCHRKSDQSSIR